MKSFFLLLFVFLIDWMQGQAPALVTKNFKFEDGIYFGFESLKSNRPDYPMNEIDAMYFVNPKTYQAQVEYVIRRSNRQFINLDDIWAICVGGIPYVTIKSEFPEKELPMFSGLRIRGKISYFSFEKTDTSKVLISAVNPVNGQPFRKGEVEQPFQVEHHRLIHWETGEIIDLTKENFLRWISDDPQLTASVLEIKEEELLDKLFKSILIYDDRHPVYLTEPKNKN